MLTNATIDAIGAASLHISRAEDIAETLAHLPRDPNALTLAAAARRIPVTLVAHYPEILVRPQAGELPLAPGTVVTLIAPMHGKVYQGLSMVLSRVGSLLQLSAPRNLSIQERRGAPRFLTGGAHNVRFVAERGQRWSVVDISRTGLSFSYPDHQSKGFLLSCVEGTLQLPNDVEVPTWLDIRHTRATPNTRTVLVGAAFVGMSSFHQSSLDQFLTQLAAPPRSSSSA